MKKERCSRCRRSVPTYDLVHLTSEGRDEGTACGRCWANVLAEKWGEDVEAVEIAPVKLKDAAGKSHTFHFRYDPASRYLRAFELRKSLPAGYQFAVRPKDDEPNVALLGRLLTKIRSGLAKTQLSPNELAEAGYTINGMSVRGRIEYGTGRRGGLRVPAVVIDGRTLSWAEFGSMLGAFEGWDFRFEVLDASDDE